MDEIVTNVRRVSDLMTEISTASQQQSDDIQQMNHAVDLIDQGTQQNAALVEEASAAARSMEEQSAQLLQTVASFRLQGGAGHRHGGGAARGLGAATGLFFLGFGVAACTQLRPACLARYRAWSARSTRPRGSPSSPGACQATPMLMVTVATGRAGLRLRRKRAAVRPGPGRGWHRARAGRR
jgi:hypothetical protein